MPVNIAFSANQGKYVMDVLFEITPIGNTVKVTAIDAETGIEVSIQGPANAGAEALKLNALRKLKYMIEKKSKGSS